MTINIPQGVSLPSIYPQADSAAGSNNADGAHRATGQAHLKQNVGDSQLARVAGQVITQITGGDVPRTLDSPTARVRVTLTPPLQQTTDPLTRKSLEAGMQRLLDDMSDPDPAGAVDPTGASGNMSAFETGDGTGSYGGTSGGIVSPVIDITAVLQLLMKAAQAQNTSARSEMQNELELKAQDEDSAAKQITAAAGERLAGAIAAGTMQIVGGVAAISSAGVNVSAARSANAEIAEMNGENTLKMQDESTDIKAVGSTNADATGAGSKNTLDVKDQSMIFNMRTSVSSGIAGMIQSSSQGLQGIGGITQGSEDTNASTDDAAKAEDDKKATLDDASYQNALNMKQQAQGNIQSVLDLMKSTNEAINQANVSNPV